jgi:hypothetical protein
MSGPDARDVLITEALELIQAEHDQMVESYTVRSAAPADSPMILDKAAKRDIDRMARWLKRARAIVQK